MPELKLAVLISGRGRTLLNLIQRKEKGELNINVRVVVANLEEAPGLQYAEKHNIPIEIVKRSEYAKEDVEGFSAEIFKICRKYRVDYVVMAGFLCKLKIAEDFQNRVLNIHPSLIPSFCGDGYYGRQVHEAALKRGVKVSGCTVHFVDDVYDHGPIILQKTVPVLENDTTDTLSDRVLYDAEFVAYPEALQLLSEERVTLRYDKLMRTTLVKILPPKDEEDAKE